jgi:putative aldouronate transport system permease protein
MYTIISITLILNVPSLLSASFEKILLLMNTQTQGVGDVLSTYTYRAGLVEQSYSYSTAVGFFISVLSVVLLLTANKIAKKLGQEGIW